MEGNYVIEGFKTVGDWTKTFYEKNKAHIFTGLGIGGTIATGILSARGGMKSARDIDREESRLGRPLDWKEKVGLTWKNYIYAGVAGLGTCFSDFKSDQINTRTIAERTTALILSEKAYEKLVTKTKEVLGEKKATQVKDAIVKEEAMPHISQEAFDAAPRIGNGALYPFMDGYSKILFWSNVDYIDLCIMKLQRMMKELEPRGGQRDYNDKIIGVPYSEWLSFIGVPEEEWNTPERRNKGWNRGYAADGDDDDLIEYTRTTFEYSPGFAVTVINWVSDPVDMKLGRILKSSAF